LLEVRWQLLGGALIWPVAESRRLRDGCRCAAPVSNWRQGDKQAAIPLPGRYGIPRGYGYPRLAHASRPSDRDQGSVFFGKERDKLGQLLFSPNQRSAWW
jgi:hypothetical protein